MTDHQLKQIEVVNQIEAQIKDNSLKFTTVSPVTDFANDTRVCLTGVHFPSSELKNEILKLISVLKDKFPEPYYYDISPLHLTIKNVRVVNDPPHFTAEDIKKAEEVFSRIIPRHLKFKVYFYRLLLFPNNLALIGTTDPELDNIVLDLDAGLKTAGVGDDKKYANSKYFLSNVTLARFSNPVSQEFRNMVEKLSGEIRMKPYTVDSVSLITTNSVLKKLHVINSWKLK